MDFLYSFYYMQSISQYSLKSQTFGFKSDTLAVARGSALIWGTRKKVRHSRTHFGRFLFSARRKRVPQPLAGKKQKRRAPRKWMLKHVSGCGSARRARKRTLVCVIVCLGSMRDPWDPMGPWYTMIIHGAPWLIMVYHDWSWCAKINHGAPWWRMATHDKSWRMMIDHGAPQLIVADHG